MSLVQLDTTARFPTVAEEAIFNRYREPLDVGPACWNERLDCLLSHRSLLRHGFLLR